MTDAGLKAAYEARSGVLTPYAADTWARIKARDLPRLRAVRAELRDAS